MKTNFSNYLLPLLFLFFLSCSRDNNPENLQQFEIAQDFLTWNELIPKQNLLISSSEEWEELKLQMQQVRGNVLESFAETTIDFQEFQVIAIFDEVRPHTGYYIEISEILENQGTLEVIINTGNGEEGYTVLTQPFYIAKIYKNSKTVNFKI